MGVARIQIGESEYANGLILLPNNWTAPDGVTFKSGFASSYSIQAYADYQTFTLEDWSKLEHSGAVFLPASGSRGGSGISRVQNFGYYWSATPNDSDYAYILNFYSYSAEWYDARRSYGQAVRLVKDMQ